MPARCTTLIFLSSMFILFSRKIPSAHGLQVNVTVQDTDSSILYQPPDLWNSSSPSSSSVCPLCPKPSPGMASQGTYHEGLVVLPKDSDDEHDADESHPTQPSHNRRNSVGSRFDADDAGFVSPNMTIQFKFTGSAIYVYCIQPLGAGDADALPTTMNVSFSMDNNPAGSFVHRGSQSASGFSPNVTVFAMAGLPEIPHVLQIQLQPNSVFIFDYLIYTHTVQFGVTSSAPPTPVQSEISTSSSSPPKVETESHRNVATFAGAVVSSVGVLGGIALCTAISIIRRRRRSARRERLDRENQPTMIGPMPFVPRYFPGTHIPTSPPPYEHSSSSSSSDHEHYRAASVPLLLAPYINDSSPRSLSYADIPPSTPPPPDDQINIVPPPPPFGVAIASPMPIAVTNALASSAFSSAASPSSEPERREDDDEESQGKITPVMVPLPASPLSESRHDMHDSQS